VYGYSESPLEYAPDAAAPPDESRRRTSSAPRLEDKVPVGGGPVHRRDDSEA
jgi:hypothetical protein